MSWLIILISFYACALIKRQQVVEKFVGFGDLVYLEA